MDQLSAGHQTAKPSILFPKGEDEFIEAQLAKLEASKSVESVFDQQKEDTNLDDFMKMDIRTATIKEAERVPKTDKLMKITVDTGIDVRTVVSGIAEFHKPEDIVGKQVSILVNLLPRKLKGIESQGMILMAQNSDGKLEFLSPQNNTDNGSVIS